MSKLSEATRGSCAIVGVGQTALSKAAEGTETVIKNLAEMG